MKKFDFLQILDGDDKEKMAHRSLQVVLTSFSPLLSFLMSTGLVRVLKSLKILEFQEFDFMALKVR